MPTATQMPTSTSTATATVTNTATAISTATVAATATATERPDPRATATAIASVIADAESEYFLPFHTLSYERGTDLKVYPDPGDDDTGFEVEDFVLDVTFVNRPTDDRTWNYGVLFGPTGDDAYYRIILQSDGTWYFAIGDETVRDGEARGVRLEDGDVNTFRVIVTDGRGIFFLNDRFTASFDLSARASSGKLWLATSTIDGSDIAFRDLSIWALPSE
jgi:hypothetical protein